MNKKFYIAGAALILIGLISSGCSGLTRQTTGQSGEALSAVVEGKHPDGDILNTDMPRWQLDDQNLDDLLTFLNTLPK